MRTTNESPRRRTPWRAWMPLLGALLLLPSHVVLAGGHGYRGHHGYGGYHGYAPIVHLPRYYDASGSRQRGGATSAELGSLDLNVRPKKAQVYLNGRHIGVADNFDGFPRQLWLEAGTHRVAFYREGYQTVVREFTIRPGVAIEVKQRLLPGKSVPPQELSRNSRLDGDPSRRRSLD